VEQTNQQPGQQSDTWRFLAELVRTALIVGLLTFAIRTFLLQPFVVQGESMSPRFHTSDYLLVNKLSYRLGEPQRGDIIVFKYPGNITINYIKRVIGLPGDHVIIADGKVRLVASDHPEGIILDEKYLPTDLQTNPVDGSASADYIVPPGNFLVLGDNRGNSSDSREWGFLPKDDIIGRAVIEAYPFNQASLIKHITYSGLN
jgi:signal peptidase I